MNIQGKINKILLALKTKGLIYKIDQKQFYIEDKDKICTKYIVYLSTPKKGEVFFSKIEMLKYLVSIYKKAGANNG